MTDKRDEATEENPRMLKVELWLKDKEQRDQVRQSLKLYRGALRHAFAVYTLAQAAGAELVSDEKKGVRLSASKDKTKAILELLFDKKGAYPAYEMRDYILKELLPGFRSFVWDGLRRTLMERWSAKDPRRGNVGRGWLVLQGAGEVGRFQRVGISFPVKTARPKLSGHELELMWSEDVGRVKFNLGKLDGGRYKVWKHVRDGEWRLGSIILSEGKNGFYALVPYYKPVQDVPLDPKRVLEVAYTGEPGRMFSARLRSGARTLVDEIRHDELSALGALDALDQINGAQARLKGRRRACGNKRRRGSGHHKGARSLDDKIAGITRKRENVTRQYNKLWASRIGKFAEQHRAGTVILFDMPCDHCPECGAPAKKGKKKCPECKVGYEKASLFGESWPWAAFVADVRTKLEDIGAALEEALSPNVDLPAAGD
jgi:hypothetical protein